MNFKLFVLAGLLAFSTSLQADIGSNYGFGSSTSALAGANRSQGYDGFVLDRSPSLMSYLPTVNSYGFLYARDQFEKIDNVQTDNYFTGGSSQTGNVETDVPDTFNFLFGSVWALGKGERDYRIGVTFSTPMDKVTEPSTNDPYQPSYYGYAADSQRLTLSAGLSGKISQNLSVGLGGHYYLVQAATYQSRMPSDTAPGRTTTGNLKTTVKPAIAPFLGTTWTDKTHWLTLYFVGARDHKLKVKTETFFGPTSSNISFDSEVTLFYDPEVWSLGYAWTQPGWDLTASVDRELWSRYDGGYGRYTFKTFQGTLKHYPVEMSFKDIWVPRLGVSRKWDESVFRFGVAYRPSPHLNLEGESNYLEPDRWIGGLGYGFKSSLWGFLEEKIQVESHFQTHYLVPREIRKTDSTSIGAPGYKVGGYVFSLGLNLIVGI